MIRIGNKIRMTEKEAASFKSMTGSQHAPKTVEEHNLKLRNAIALFESVADDSAEAKFMVYFCERDLIKI